MLVAHEMGVEVSENYRKIDIKKEIIASKEYDEEVVKFQLDAMVEDRRVKMEREAQKIREEREYELEKLRITQVADISLLPSGSGENFRPVKNMKYVMQKYDPENSDMVLFLTLFERQARKAKIEETKKLDDYETSRRFAKKSVAYRPPEKKVVEEPGKYGRPRIDNKARNERSGVNNWKGTPGRDLNWRDREFERRRPAACYQCGSTDHLRPQCPELRRQNTERVNNINSVGKFGPVFAPYLSQGRVNSIETTILRDSGTSVDVAPAKLVNPEDYTGEVVWVKQALENNFRCLPIAKIVLEGVGFGCIQTKAAIVDNSVDMEHYLLGNYTQELIDSIKHNSQPLNVVVTRSQVQREKVRTKGEVKLGKEIETDQGEFKVIPEEVRPELQLPVASGSKCQLVQIDSATFCREQKLCTDLKCIWEKVGEGNSTEFVEEKGLLFRKTRDHVGTERKKVLVPACYRKSILSLCHEGLGGHTGVTKTKDKLLRYYWPQCTKDADVFVKTCEPCQRVGKAQETKKAPLKLVPIIKEVFSRVCIDTVGPLPCSGKGNRHLVTALCVASKYPEAVPVADIRSETVTDALLLIFSRWGFPKVLQCDNGTSFTSNLTSTFFEKFGIRVVHSSVRHPQSNSVERWHRTLKRLLKDLCVESGKDWEKILPAALLALRTVTHETTGFSPAELVHGKNLRTPETLIFEQWVEPPEGECAVTEYVFELINRMKQCQELASARAAEVRDKRKVYYDRGSVNRKFRPGDRVLVLAASRPNKLAVQWVGPGTIESQLSDTNYVVKLPGRTEKNHIYHVNLLKPYHQREENVNLLIGDEVISDVNDSDLEIPYPSANPNIFDFEDIARSSDLFERYTEEQIEQLGRLLGSHRSIFSNEPGRTDLIEHDIHLISDQPVRSRPYRTSPRQNEILRGEIKRMLDLKIIEIGESDYTSPMILVEAPGKDPRPCIDYRKLNSIIRMEIFPLPDIEDRVERVCAANFISVIDLTKGYWQIPLTARAQRLAAFVTTFGTYRPLVLPFGLVNAPFGFSKFVSVITGVRGVQCTLFG
ncbi:hypothetical protein JTE90_015611 [Oedothorax gibbosus]|uniref:RNA-directed DNA polymerase n=1 Tax=Oedothorax gibbosus TaxID=931172 RepID=A0AAV6UWR3_9ARAC|nr:hypothetical protein JTE90_015611 [Oedothorax gibbosus]